MGAGEEEAGGRGRGEGGGWVEGKVWWVVGGMEPVGGARAGCKGGAVWKGQVGGESWSVRAGPGGAAGHC